jgi:hypothetical protein
MKITVTLSNECGIKYVLEEIDTLKFVILRVDRELIALKQEAHKQSFITRLLYSKKHSIEMKSIQLSILENSLEKETTRLNLLRRFPESTISIKEA